MHKIICPYNTVHTVPDQTEHVEIDGNDFNTKENGRTIDASMEEQKLHIMKTIGMKDEDYDIHAKECSEECKICLTHFSRIYDYFNLFASKTSMGHMNDSVSCCTTATLSP